MRPYIHAKSSAGLDGRPWIEDLAIHEFIDSSKVAFSEMRHRLILHSGDFGAALTSMAFPDRMDAVAITHRHIKEDLGWVPDLKDWLKACRPEDIVRPRFSALSIDRDAIIDKETKRQRLLESSWPAKVFDFLSMPAQMAPDFADVAGFVLANSFGVSLVRRIIGPPLEVRGKNDTKVIFDPASCAEAMIYGIYHSIPDLRRVLLPLNMDQMEIKNGEV
jgi:hypothetical protein